MSSIAGGPGGDPAAGGGEPPAVADPSAQHSVDTLEPTTPATEGRPDELQPGRRQRPRPRHSLLRDLELLIPFLIAVAILIAVVVGLVITVRPHPNTNGTVYHNSYNVLSNGS